MFRTDITERFEQLKAAKNCEVTQAIIEQLIKQDFHGQLSYEVVDELCEKFKRSRVELALYCIAIAACYAVTPVSDFNVGAVAIGKNGDFYFGANQEFSGECMQQSVHAEQSAISHAFLAGETLITDVVVNYTPCGHCRQFMNELNSAASLKVHLPHSQNNLLHSYLPDSFGPKDLGIEKVLFDEQPQQFEVKGDHLQQAAIFAANNAYAPYSNAFSGVALQVGERIVCGKYTENAAFNPTFLPLQSALNYRLFLGLADIPVTRVVLAEAKGSLSSYAMTQALAKSLFGLEIEYLSLQAV
ncbi:TPA: cytidine deaminase [Mannheimia haemolytica]|uniref:Cytidine deaminase n=2 Tax=Mannheimia haemolytica TaxID=75985 RepID=A0A547EKM8_MANHA|nr:cytidine deaminase [Mannheimia haemolytica]AWW71035.1 cytidine deaminase [Pasteurellaceae bacterium 12565]AGI32143.1 cytidine deaminase [Mannheimia haemolytica USDA-ARS-USMARC-183]AGI35743.1 cytidine deaminase [Mannheimia haemolytica USDA-ARS-USMARC-185]AGK03028.1 cytidine deaminase Cdd [Mannheimia haemolytica M42548]AGQ25115.1 cytidine deaminase [Mannheimia haemolytica D153]